VEERGRCLLLRRGLNGKAELEELELAVLLGHGYKWMAAASTVIYE
jgi:hypothetical protein